jgi:hypothetical protein
LVRLEYVVDIDPMMRLLPEGTSSERVADVEDIAIDFLVGMSSEVLC